MKDLNRIEIRMYGTGTGDCFVVKFLDVDNKSFNIMIDGGAWNNDRRKLRAAVSDLKKYVDNQLDVLVITHEHLDHVNMFDVAEDLFKAGNFKIEEIWMAWTEDDKDNLAQQWKKQYGQKKRALSLASTQVRNLVNTRTFKRGFSQSFNKEGMFNAFDTFSTAIENFEELHYLSEQGMYKGDLKGMKVIRELCDKDRIRYFEPGDIERKVHLPGISFYILGPPRSLKSVRKEKGRKEGETYDHNKVLRRSDSFALAMNTGELKCGTAPFEPKYFEEEEEGAKSDYRQTNSAWRNIDLDWLLTGAGNLALRLNTGLNNLSLVFAIEIESTGEVLLFTGDAEFGNWESWHQINWPRRGSSGKHLTEDLLNRTVFYKVAHHLSHNGTARDKGLKMMTSKKLVSMASLDYSAISPRWKSTMPNRAILKELITRTRGRLIVMNENELYTDFYEEDPLPMTIEDAQARLSPEEKKAFRDGYKESNLFKQITLKVR